MEFGIFVVLGSGLEYGVFVVLGIGRMDLFVVVGDVLLEFGVFVVLIGGLMVFDLFLGFPYST